jgi:hypothetical protein
MHERKAADADLRFVVEVTISSSKASTSRPLAVACAAVWRAVAGQQLNWLADAQIVGSPEVGTTFPQ